MLLNDAVATAVAVALSPPYIRGIIKWYYCQRKMSQSGKKICASLQTCVCTSRAVAVVWQQQFPVVTQTTAAAATFAVSAALL